MCLDEMGWDGMNSLEAESLIVGVIQLPAYSVHVIRPFSNRGFWDFGLGGRIVNAPLTSTIVDKEF